MITSVANYFPKGQIEYKWREEEVFSYQKKRININQNLTKLSNSILYVPQSSQTDSSIDCQNIFMIRRIKNLAKDVD